eukprot:133079-Prymnesium_polylepis.1
MRYVCTHPGTCQVVPVEYGRVRPPAVAACRLPPTARAAASSSIAFAIGAAAVGLLAVAAERDVSFEPGMLAKRERCIKLWVVEDALLPSELCRRHRRIEHRQPQLGGVVQQQ